MNTNMNMNMNMNMNNPSHLLSPGTPRSATPSTPPRYPPPRSPIPFKQNREHRPHNNHSRALQYHEMSPQSPHHSSTPPPLPTGLFQTKGKDRATPSNELPQNTSKNPILDPRMERFDFDDFRNRFDATMATHMKRDRELVEEYKRVASTFQAWVSVLGQFDQDTDLARRESQITSLREKEDELDAYRERGRSAVQDIQSILERIGGVGPPQTPSRLGHHNNPSDISSRNSNASGTSRPPSRAAGLPPAYRNPSQGHRLGRGFMGSKVPGNGNVGNTS